MTKFMLRANTEDKWKHQNEATLVDCFEGTLVDNELYACKRGYCVAYEKPLNERASTKVYEFAPYKDEDACAELIDEFTHRHEEVAMALWLNELAYAKQNATA